MPQERQPLTAPVSSSVNVDSGRPYWVVAPGDGSSGTVPPFSEWQVSPADAPNPFYQKPEQTSPRVELPPELPVSEGLIWRSGTGRDVRSCHLTHEGVVYLQQIVSAYTRTRGIEGGVIQQEQLNEFVDFLEGQYKNVAASERTDEQWFAATVARLYRGQLQRMEKSGTQEVSTSVYSLFVDKGKYKRSKLTVEGKHFIDLTIRRGKCVDDQQNLKYKRLQELHGWLNERAESQAGDAEAFFKLAARSVESRARMVEQLSQAESLAVSNSPWNKVISRIREIPQYHHVPEGFIRTMIAPYVAELDSAANQFSTDDLDKTMLSHVAAELMVQAIPQIQENASHKGDSFESFMNQCLAQVAGEGTTPTADRAELMEAILCKSRFVSEAPVFVLQQIQTRLELLKQNYAAATSDTLKAQWGEKYSDKAASQYISSLREEQSNLEAQYSEMWSRFEYVQSRREAIHDRYDLANELRRYFTDHENVDYEDALYAVNDMSWVPEDYKHDLAEEIGHAHQGLKGKLLGLGASAARAVRRLVKPSSDQSKLETMYHEHIHQKAQQYEARYNRAEIRSLFGLANLTHEAESHTWMKRTNVLRLAMMGLDVVAGVSGQTEAMSEASLKQILEGPVTHAVYDGQADTDILHNSMEAVGEAWNFFSNLFAPAKGLEIKGQEATPTMDNLQDRIQKLKETQDVTQEAARITPETTLTTEATQAATKAATEAPTQESTETPVVVETVVPAQPEQETPEPESHNLIEYFLGQESGLYKMFLEARIARIEQMSPQEQAEYFEAIGGPENIDNGLITFMIVGEDRTVDDGSSHRYYKYGHSDQTQMVSFNPKTNELTVLSLARTSIIPENNHHSLTQVMWHDNPESKSGRTEPQGDQIMQRLGENVGGIPVDGVISFSIDGAGKFVDAMFPNGIDYRIGEGEGFTPTSETLGVVSGYTEGGYKPFVEGEVYHFDNGEQLTDFLRSRKTSEHGYYDRESRAAGVFGRLLDIMWNNAKAQPLDTINFLLSVSDRVEELENNDLMRVHWGVSVEDPDSDQQGQLSQRMGDLMQVVFSSLSAGDNVAQLLKSASVSMEQPSVTQFSMSPYAEQPELKMVSVNNETSQLAPVDSAHNAFSAQPLQYWSTVRAFMQDHFHNGSDASGELQPTAPEVKGPVSVMFLGDSQVSSGFLPDKAIQLMQDLGLQVEAVGGQTAGPSESVHEGHGGYSTADILRDLNDRQWGESDGSVSIFDAKPEVVVIQLGTNDASKGLTTDQTINNLSGIITKLREENPSVKVVLSVVPPLTDPVLDQRVDQINARLPELVNALNQSDSFPDSQVVMVKGGEELKASDLGDGVHLNYSGEDKVARMQAEAVHELLGK